MARLDSDRRVEERLARHDRSDGLAHERLAARRLRFDPDLDDGSQDDFAVVGESAELEDADGSAEPGHSLSSLRSLLRVPGQRRAFGRRQLLVVAMVVAVGLLVAGWAVLRARPVALASPIGEPTSVPSSPASAPPSVPGSAAAAATAAAAPAPAPAEASQTAGPGSGTGQTTSGATAGAPPSAAVIEVHVLGAVRRPGVVRLAPGARVNDAIRAAGGLTRSAAPGRLNLAQPLGDGQQLYLARAGHGTSQLRDPTPTGGVSTASTGGSVDGGAAGSSGSAASGGTGAASGTASAAKIDLNQATEADLDQLPGIGPVTAGKIIAWRAEHGRFTKIEELEEVDGIGPKTFADLAGRVKV